MSDGSLENIMLGVVERWAAGRYTERHGIVTSYDPKNYLAKVTFQPEGQESGWLPIETGHIGEGYGIVIGLQPGQGGVNAQGQGGQAGPQQNNQGDQVIVRYQEGDFESGKIVQRVHSDQDTPPQAQSGEIIIWTKFQKSGGPQPDAAQGGQGGEGQKIYLKNDGSITVTDGNGATTVYDGKGDITVDVNNYTLTSQ
jgi:phage baseplate assembly protein gpV